MGYDLHITKKEHWSDTETSDISLEEWLTHANADDELELTEGYEIKIGAETEFKNRPGFCEWNAHPTDKEPNARPWFDYWRGSITAKNPDEPTIRKMIQIASALNARVQGDDGEIYNEEYLLELENTKNQKASLSRKNKRAWWKFW